MFDGDWGGGAAQIAAKGLWAARILNTFEQNQNPQVGQVAQPRVFIIYFWRCKFPRRGKCKIHIFIMCFVVVFVFCMFSFVVCIYCVPILYSIVNFVNNCVPISEIYAFCIYFIFILYVCLYIDKNTK